MEKIIKTEEEARQIIEEEALNLQIEHYMELWDILYQLNKVLKDPEIKEALHTIHIKIRKIRHEKIKKGYGWI